MVNWPNPPFATNDKHSGAVSWFTRLVQAAKSNAITNVIATGGGRAKLKQNTSGQTLEINFPGGGTPPDFFYPFKIYQPPISMLSNTGTTFDANGNPQSITIDASQPTNLPTTVNPNTDGWRIWAVRNGLVNARSYHNICFAEQFFLPDLFARITASDFSTLIEPSIGFDSVGITGNDGLSYGFDPNNNTTGFPVKITPIVLPFDFNQNGLYLIAFGIQIDMEDLTAKLMGFPYDGTGFETIFPNPSDSSFIPLGVISSLGAGSGGSAKNLTAYNFLTGNIVERYGLFQNNNGNGGPGELVFSSTLNYRGDFLNDTGLHNLVFYPGDVVKIQRVLDFTANSTSTVHAPGTGTVTTSTTVKIQDVSGSEGNSNKLFAQSLYMMTAVGFTNDPSTDPNWVKISGLDVATQTNPTPNT